MQQMRPSGGRLLGIGLNAHKRPRNWVSSRNETGEQSTANCEILVANIGVDAQNVSNIKKERITARKGSGIGITARKGSGVRITAQKGSGIGITARKGSGVGITAQKVSGIHMGEDNVTALVESGTMCENVILV